ncbi:unnamed protein product, partial [Discosporangium mesarthrocarpum]
MSGLHLGANAKTKTPATRAACHRSLLVDQGGRGDAGAAVAKVSDIAGNSNFGIMGQKIEEGQGCSPDEAKWEAGGGYGGGKAPVEVCRLEVEAANEGSACNSAGEEGGGAREGLSEGDSMRDIPLEGGTTPAKLRQDLERSLSDLGKLSLSMWQSREEDQLLTRDHEESSTHSSPLMVDLSPHPSPIHRDKPQRTAGD